MKFCLNPSCHNGNLQKRMVYCIFSSLIKIFSHILEIAEDDFISLLKRWQNYKSIESSLKDFKRESSQRINNYQRESSLKDDDNYRRESSLRDGDNGDNYKRYSGLDIDGEVKALIEAAQMIGSIKQQGI